MPPLPPITMPTCLRLSWSQNDDGGERAGSRIYISYSSSAPSGGALNTLAGVASGAWASHLASLVSSAEGLFSVTVQDLASDEGNVGTSATVEAGTRSGGPLPASACMVINHYQNRHYRGGRPRTYLRCGVDSDLEGTNQWTSAFQTAVLGGWEAFVAEILADSTAGITLEDDVLVSYYNGPITPTPPYYKKRSALRTSPLVSNITSSEVATKIGSQRRRLN